MWPTCLYTILVLVFINTIPIIIQLKKTFLELTFQWLHSMVQDLRSSFASWNYWQVLSWIWNTHRKFFAKTSLGCQMKGYLIQPYILLIHKRLSYVTLNKSKIDQIPHVLITASVWLPAGSAATSLFSHSVKHDAKECMRGKWLCKILQVIASLTCEF